MNGHALPEGYSYCGKCGSPALPIPVVAPPVVPPTPKVDPEDPGRPEGRKRLWILVAVLGSIAITVPIAIGVVTNQEDSPTAQEVRVDLVTEVCEVDEDVLPPIGNWEVMTGKLGTGQVFRTTAGATVIVMFRAANSAETNQDISRVLCYPPGGGSQYANLRVTWDDDGLAYQLTDDGPPDISASPGPSSTPPRYDSSTPVEPEPTPNPGTSDSPQGDSCASIADIPLGAQQCAQARLIISECEASPPLTFVAEIAGNSVWKARDDRGETTPITSHDPDQEVGLLSCGTPSNEINLPDLVRQVSTQSQEAYGITVTTVACQATGDSTTPIDELPLGPSLAVCAVRDGQQSPAYVFIDVVAKAPGYLLTFGE